MQVELIYGNSISAEHVKTWKAILADNPQLQSPFYRPEFTQAVAGSRTRIEVAVLKNSDQIIGYFPFRRVSPFVGQPVGGRLSASEGLICRPGTYVDMEELLLGSELTSWDFSQVPVDQTVFEPHAFERVDSHYIDLSGGYESYCQTKKDSGSKRICKLKSLERKLEREHGPINFELHTSEVDVLDQLFEQKSKQFQETHFTDVFHFDWTRLLLEQLLEQNDPNLRGRLSTLSVGGKQIAISYALQSNQIIYGWFTTFDHDFGKYSPGSLLILKIAEAAAAEGVTRFDLGTGEQLFKKTLKSGSTEVLSGCLTNNSMRRYWIKGIQETKEWLSHSPVRFTLDMLRPIKGWFDMR